MIVGLLSTFTAFANQAFDPGDITAQNVKIPVQIEAQTSELPSIDATFALERTIHRTVLTTQTVTLPECLDIPVDPAAGDWKGFWDTSTTDKAQRLSFAINGLTSDDAQKILNNGFFQTRPRFWSEFVLQIRNAELVLTQLGYSAHFYEPVIITHGEVNAKSLGYWSDTQCRMSTTTRQVPTVVTEKVPAGTEDRRYFVKVQNAVFQNFESDHFSLSFGLKTDDVSIDGKPSLFNDYQIQPVLNPDHSVTVYLSATRNLVDIPDSAINGTLTRTSSGFYAGFAVLPEYLATNEPASKLMLEYHVCHPVFLGCRDIESATVEMTSNQLLVKLTGTYTVGDGYVLRYRFYRTQSKFYSDEGTTRESNKVRY